MENKLHYMKLNKKNDEYNDKMFEKIYKTKQLYEKEYHKKNFRDWLSSNYNDQYGISDFHGNLLNYFIDDTIRLLTENNFKIDKNLYKDNLASYIYYNNNN
tara:strand:+ start:636 stop:938 length:303 start_codon:yes stop_codon:yes gene_type:complete